MNEVLAVVRIPDGVSKAVPTFPGQHLKFVGGVAEVRHERHMPSVLTMPDARVELDAGWADFLPKWVGQIGGDAKVTCDLKVNPTHVAEEVGPEPVADAEDTVPFSGASGPPTKYGWGGPVEPSEDDLAKVVFGKHPAGHGCKFCEDKRRRARQAAAKG